MRFVFHTFFHNNSICFGRISGPILGQTRDDICRNGTMIPQATHVNTVIPFVTYYILYVIIYIYIFVYCDLIYRRCTHIYIILCYIMLNYIILYHIILYHIISYSIILYHIISYYIISYYTILYYIMLIHSLLCNTDTTAWSGGPRLCPELWERGHGAMAVCQNPGTPVVHIKIAGIYGCSSP